MNCLHGFFDPRDCAICMQLELDDVGDPGVATPQVEVYSNGMMEVLVIQ